MNKKFRELQIQNVKIISKIEYCNKCNKPFSNMEDVYRLIFYDGTESYICDKCFEQFQKDYEKK